MARKDPEERWRRRMEDRARLAAQGQGARPRSRLELFARELNLDITTEVDGFVVMEGQLRRSHVRVEGQRDGSLAWSWRAEVAPHGLPDSLAISKDGSPSSLRKALRGRDIVTGDEPFDSALFVRGDEAVALALLDHKTRAKLLELVERVEVVLADGRIRFETTSRAETPPRAFRARLREAVALGWELSFERKPLEQRLLDGAKKDPEPRHRAGCAELLAEVAPDRLGRLSISDVGRLPHEPRLRIACVLGEAAIGLLDRLVIEGDARIKAGAIEAIARLAPRMELYRSLSEPSLLGLLDEGSLEVKLVAADTLGETGSAPAIEALARASTGLFVRRALKERAKAAVAAIEARTGRGKKGGLSLADRRLDRSGALSHAADQGGLAVIDRDEGG